MQQPLLHFLMQRKRFLNRITNDLTLVAVKTNLITL